MDSDFDKIHIKKCLEVITGEVVHGRGLGRSVNLPTANINADTKNLKLEYGVYATIITIDQNKYYSITNIGTRPTVSDSFEITIETHIIDFDMDIYGKIVKLEVYKYIRGIKKFSSLSRLKEQTENDKRVALEYFQGV